MARQRRYFLPGQPLHVIQRGNNRQAVFFCEDDYARYTAWLIEAAERHACAVHAYVFMTNHVHLLVTPKQEASVPRMMQSLGRRYVREQNMLYRRSGTLWEGRYRAAPIDSEAYFLACCRYIELNPVRARMVAQPGDYRWSSYAAHAHGNPDPLARDHFVYRSLGLNDAQRQESYRELFREQLGDDFVEALRTATQGGWAMGSDRFKQEIPDTLARRVIPLTRGRRKKAQPDTQQELFDQDGVR